MSVSYADPVPLPPRYAEVLDGLTTAIVVLSEQQLVRYLNVAAESMFDFSREHALGKHWATLVPAASELNRMISRGVTSSDNLMVNEMLVETAPGRERVLDCRLSSIASGDRLLELMDAGLRLQRNRESALMTQRSVARTIGRQLAHEIKNPLAGLRGAAQLLSRHLEPPLDDHTRIIIAETDRLTTLVDTMLGPDQPAQYESANLHRLLHHVFDMLKLSAADGVTLIEDYDPSLPPLMLDANQITQALLNLGKNGIHAIAAGGTLILRTRAESGYMLRGKRHALVARIDFEDDGPGVAEEIRDTLFYPLVTGRSDGTGLGLALAQELIDRHGGLIQLRSVRNPTRFSIYLPVRQ